ncbi:MAG: hypothetical protein WBD25_20100 [Terriglobales bacterium]
MRYWPLLTTIVVIALVLIGIHNVREKRSQQRRDAAYQALLGSYSEITRPGMSRKEVEDLLHVRNQTFRQMCCVDIKKPIGAWDDLVKIAQEDPPWVCSEKNIYIAFQFTGTRAPATPPSAEPSDKLTAVSVYPRLEGCP